MVSPSGLMIRETYQGFIITRIFRECCPHKYA